MKIIKPFLSVVIPVHNSGSTLSQCLSALERSRYRNYEIIVVDDGSKDDSINIAKGYTNKLLKLENNTGRLIARRKGENYAKGEIILNIDSDVVIFPKTLEIIDNYFKKNRNIAAITGLLSKKNPYKNFSSQYKNLYMHFHFMKLPLKVNFLYGSIYAFRKKYKKYFSLGGLVKVADDTESGQRLQNRNLKIVFLKDLEVIHLKQYFLLGLVKNDFRIPFDWAHIFWKYQGWKQLGRQGTGFAHASKEQLVSLLVAPAIVVSLFVNMSIFTVLLMLWVVLNWRFHWFLYQERGLWFATRAIIFTFFDDLIMLAGIICGTGAYFKKLV